MARCVQLSVPFHGCLCAPSLAILSAVSHAQIRAGFGCVPPIRHRLFRFSVPDPEAAAPRPHQACPPPVPSTRPRTAVTHATTHGYGARGSPDLQHTHPAVSIWQPGCSHKPWNSCIRGQYMSHRVSILAPPLVRPLISGQRSRCDPQGPVSCCIRN